MKNLVCPISTERISDQIPRVNALLVIALLVLYAIINSWIIPAFLAYDFFARGYMNAKYSILAKVSVRISKILPGKGKRIDKAPKIFAARLGFLFTTAIVVAHFFSLPAVGSSISGMLIVFAGLECVFNFCLGCWVFTLFVQPFYSKI
jgi:hypothetical protein